MILQIFSSAASCLLEKRAEIRTIGVGKIRRSKLERAGSSSVREIKEQYMLLFLYVKQIINRRTMWGKN